MNIRLDKKKVIISIVALIVAVIELCLCIATFVNAYLYDKNNAQLSQFSVLDNGSNTISVATETDFAQAVFDTKSNSDADVSTISINNRKTIVFSEDILLTSDILVTADCHINLNQKTLYLNGHTLTIAHDYMGTFMLTNGTVNAVDATNKVVINTPRAMWINHDLIFEGGATSTDCLIISDPIDNYLAYNVFYMIGAKLSDTVDDNNARRYYGDTLIEAGDFSQIYFLSNHADCAYCTGNAPHYCCYISDSVDLPRYFHDYDINISYSSDNTSAFTNDGRAKPTQGTVKTANLTVNLTHIGEETPFATKIFTIHVVHVSDTDWAQIGYESVIEYIQRFYSEIDEDDNGTIDWTGYRFGGEAQVPATMDNGVTIKYETYSKTVTNDVPSYTLLDSTDNINVNTGESTKGHFRQSSDNVYTMALNSQVMYIKIQGTANGATISSDYLPVRGDSAVIKDNYTIAQSIIRKWYGDSIDIHNATTNGAGTINGYTTKVLNTDVSLYTADGVLSVAYDLINNSDGVYAITTNNNILTLHVVAGFNPDQLQTVFVKATFTFDNEMIEITIPIIYLPNSDEGNTQIHPFLPYYTYFNRIFVTATANNTYMTFDMMFNYSDKCPIVCFDILGDTNNVITVKLYYNGQTRTTLTLGDNTSLTQSFDSYLSSNNLNLSTILAYGDAKWIIEIDKDKIQPIDTTIDLVYNYKFSTTDATWTTYNKSYSTFVLTGILRCVKTNGTSDSESMPDTNLYKWVYDNFNPKNDTYTIGTDAQQKYILSSWMTKNFTLNNSGNTLGINNYKGLEYLDGVKKVNLSNCGINNDSLIKNTATYLGGMEQLEDLNLSNNGIFDRANGTYAFPEGNDNRFIGLLASATNLKILDLSDNKIYSFQDLPKLNSLTTVYLYNNSFTANLSWFFEGLNSTLEGLANSIYGSNGSTNLPIYQTLYNERGVSIYILNRNTTFTGGIGASDYDRIAGIEYQDRLVNGVSIAKVYADFSTNPIDYGITAPGTIVSDDATANSSNNNCICKFKVTYSYSGDPTTTDEFTVVYSYDKCLQTGSSSYQWFTISMHKIFRIERID